MQFTKEDVRYRLAVVLNTTPYKLEQYSVVSMFKMLPLAYLGWTLEELDKVHDVAFIIENFKYALQVTHGDVSRAKEMVLNAVDLLRSQVANADAGESK